jgi:hypothetical protein
MTYDRGMAKAGKTNQKPSKPGRGRPPTDVVWKGIGVRFTESEKAELERVAASLNQTQAEFIRQATIRLVADVKRTGKLEISAVV